LLATRGEIVWSDDWLENAAPAASQAERRTLVCIARKCVAGLPRGAYPSGKRFFLEEFMRPRSLSLTFVASLTLLLIAAPTETLRAQAPAAALSGQVSSAEEGAMEGVLVSAKKPGSTITVTVASDKDGRYSFPAARLEPGQYAVSIRAVGYDADGRPSAEVAAGRTATLSSCARPESSHPSSPTPNGSSARPARRNRSSPTTIA
jgi:Carboxypeptidase regulatory-like domain